MFGTLVLAVISGLAGGYIGAKIGTGEIEIKIFK